MTVRIGVVSDTHLSLGVSRRLPAELFEHFDGVDLILHAGDLCTLQVLAELEAIAPTLAVYGNCDPFAVTEQVPSERIVEVGGCRIGLTHGHLGHRPTAENARWTFIGQLVQAVVFGHSHQPMNEVKGGVLMFNPGSATDPRRQPHPTIGLLTVTDGTLTGEIIPLRGVKSGEF